jgi:hypothetical protein
MKNYNKVDFLYTFKIFSDFYLFKKSKVPQNHDVLGFSAPGCTLEIRIQNVLKVITVTQITHFRV